MLIIVFNKLLSGNHISSCCRCTLFTSATSAISSTFSKPYTTTLFSKIMEEKGEKKAAALNLKIGKSEIDIFFSLPKFRLMIYPLDQLKPNR